ncbi:MAG: amidophosphoribosyltransferase [bacterium]|nr:amidophosphoribosyltransferase [bacterium]MDE0436944.1 amidophosphoribosyltransferase [bacterium]
MVPGSGLDSPRERCGVVGVYAADREAARITFFGLFALQHRGQEAAGIVSYDGLFAHVHKGEGLVGSVFNEDILSSLRGSAAVGHTRYSTTGGSTLRNAQPQVIETIDGPLAVAHNGNLVNAPQLRRRLLERGVGLQTSSDTELMVHVLTGAGGSWLDRIRTLMDSVEGAYSLTILTREAVYGVRDPWGFRPLVIGEIDGGYVLASETCAFSTTGAKFVAELRPGEIARIDALGLHIEQGAPPQKRAFCTFENIYFSRPDTVHDGNLVHSVRQRLGRELAREAPVEADLVLSVPDSGTPHAVGFAQEAGLPYTEGLIKNRYVGRTFIEPTQELRNAGVAMKFNPLRDNLAGRRIVMVDDSIVRGTTGGQLVRMLRDAGASEVHVRVACPAITHPCYMGIDMATPEELVASRLSVAGIRDEIGADSLAFLSIEGLMRALDAEDGYCNACFTGDYPFEPEQFVQLQLGLQDPFASVWGE